MTADSKHTDAAESVLSRWSRRKRQAREETAAEGAPQEEFAAVVEQPVQDIEEAPLQLTDADMPDIESLSEESDFSVFMSPGVSDELRNLALRKLFHAPLFNIRDGLDEYDEDYTSFEKLGDIVTCDMKHQIEMQEKKRREALEQEQQAEQDVAEIEEIVDDDEAEPGQPDEPDQETEVAASAPAETVENKGKRA